MKKVFSIVCVPFNLKGENGQVACLIDTAFETEAAAEKYLRNSDILKNAVDMPYIVAIVPSYSLALQPA